MSCGNPFAYGLCGWVPVMQQPESKVRYTVDEAYSEADVGTIFLFSGHGFQTVLAEIFSPSIWSHMGLVCRGADGRLGLIESVRHADELPTLGVLKPWQKSPLIGGVRVVDLREKLEKYRGYAVAMRVLKCRQSDKARITKILSCTIHEFLKRFHGNAYSSKIFDFVDARFRMRSVLTEDDKVNSSFFPDDREFFCSEIVAQIFIDAGLLSPRLGRASQYLPDDFDENGGVALQCPKADVSKAPLWGPARFIAIPYAYENLLDRLFSNATHKEPPVASILPVVDYQQYTSHQPQSPRPTQSYSSMNIPPVEHTSQMYENNPIPQAHIPFRTDLFTQFK